MMKEVVGGGGVGWSEAKITSVTKTFQFPWQKSIATEEKISQKITNLSVNYLCKNICMYRQYFSHGNLENSFRYDYSIVLKIQHLAKNINVNHFIKFKNLRKIKTGLTTLLK